MEEDLQMGHYARKLNRSEVEKLKRDDKLVPDFKQNKLELEACKNWDLFYKRNSVKFFKDRHWTVAEFKELCEIDNDESQKRTLLEVGCGVGNFIFPLIEDNTDLFIYACDFSKRAVEFVKENKLYDSLRCHAFVCDVTSDKLVSTISPETVDLVSLIFVLSAIHPNKMLTVISNIFQVLKPGGLVIFRDYGLYDQAMLRFSSGHKLTENFYVRQDGTRAYYFSEEMLRNIFQDAGFQVKDVAYIQRRTVNKKENIDVPRIFIQGKFIKPISAVIKPQNNFEH